MNEEAELVRDGVGPQLSPLMRQYLDVGSHKTPMCCCFRVGDFYELFDSDAQVASRELDITLTGRPESSYPGGRCPMAGVPVRAHEAYLANCWTKVTQ